MHFDFLFFGLTLRVLALLPEERRGHADGFYLLLPRLDVGLRGNQFPLLVEPFASLAHAAS